MNSVSSNHAQSLAAGLSRLQPLLDASNSRISSGQRIDRPASDISGVGMASKLDGQQARLEAVEVNLQNGMSRSQVATAQLSTLSRIVTRLSELSTLQNNPVQTDATRQLYATEATELQNQLRQTIGGTTAEVGGESDVGRPLGVFNGRELFGSDGGDVIAIGLQSDEKVTLPSVDLRHGAMGLLFQQDGSGNFTFDISDAGAGSVLNAALDQLSAGQAEIGAVQSRLELAASATTTARTNTEAALSSIRDVDIAQETTTYTRLQILSESYTAMVAQARDANAKLLPLLNRG